MKKLFSVILAVIFLLTSVSHILATPGKLRSASIISCNGINYGQHGDDHWHIAVEHPSGWYPSGASLGYDNPCATSQEEIPNTSNIETLPVAEVIKSNDTSLKEIMINSESFTEFNSTIRFSTTDEVVSIAATPGDSEATLELESKIPLEIGVNTQMITVTAEDGTVATYTLEITREKIESSNANLDSLLVDSEELPVSNEMEYVTGNKSISISATAEDENANIEIDNYQLEIGINEIQISVIAEDGTIKEYVLIVQRLSDNTGIVVTINDQEIVFDSFQAELTVDHRVEELELSYVLDDPNAMIEEEYSQELREGENEVIIRVTAENGDTQQYVIIVTRSSNTSITGIVTFLVLSGGGISAALVHFFKKDRNRKTK